MNSLTIDTTDNTKTVIHLDTNGKKKTLSRPSGKWRSQNVLLLVNEILEKNKINLKNLDEINVNEGPGSFTGIRVGVAIANALGQSLSIPINHKKVGDLVDGKYK